MNGIPVANKRPKMKEQERTIISQCGSSLNLLEYINPIIFGAMKIFRALYSIYALIVFIILFLILFPFMLVPIINSKKHNWVGSINRIWARIFFTLIFIPITVEYVQGFDKGRQYILCPNHFSYIDIPIMGRVELNTIFVGKSSLEKIPLFGWMFRKLHITVDRESLKGRYTTYLRSLEVAKEGKNLTIFPEGGIMTQNPPELARFKDGAFRVAVNSQTPLVPVSIVNNWILLPEDLLLRWCRIKVIIHPAIEVDGMGEKDIPDLKKKVAKAIEEGLVKEHGN